MLDLAQLAIVASAVLGTSFLSGIFGMAGGMMLMGFLLAIMPVSAAMALHGVTQMVSNGWRAWLWRAHIRWRTVIGHAAGSLVAAIAFACLTVRPTKAEALLILGLTPFIGLALPARAQLNAVRPAHAFGCGVVCMGLQLLAGVSGPVLDLFFVNSRLDRRAVIATKAIVQALGHAVKLAYFGALLAVDGGELPAMVVATAIALALIGTHASRRVLDVMSDAQFRTWSRRLIVAVAAVYLTQGALIVVNEARATATTRVPASETRGDMGRWRQAGADFSRPARAGLDGTHVASCARHNGSPGAG
jgi:uncharacterized protein